MNEPVSESRLIDIEVTYLEMLDPSQLHPSRQTVLDVREAEIPLPELNRFLYTAVGTPWGWVHRLSWTYRDWQEYLQREELRTWVGYVRGTPAGYFELERQGADVEIRSFGLLPPFMGRGMGGDLLTRAVGYAWSWHASRVWLHTCTLDSPAGLRNYLARGFRVYRTQQIQETMSLERHGPW